MVKQSSSNSASSPALNIDDITCSVPGRVLFHHVSILVEIGESVAVLGPSGVGKSTLLAAVLGIRGIDAGSIYVVGERLDNKRHAQRTEIRRRHIGMVFQHGELLDELTAVENVAIAAMLSLSNVDDPMTESRAILESLGVAPDTLTGSQSGGERQRTALARALVARPEVILADEPTASLDSATKAKAADLLFDAPARFRCGLLIATHDMDIAERADHVLKLAAPG